jgi:hypothetical protein
MAYEGVQYSYACYNLLEPKVKKGVKTAPINLPNPNPIRFCKNLDNLFSLIRP